jgi:hypothetical protein
MATAAREIVPASTGRKVERRGGRRVGAGRPTWQPKKVERVFKEEIEKAPGIKEKREIKRLENQAEAWERTREAVQHYTAIGYPREIIARIVDPPCDPDTLAKHFRFELDNGKYIADAKMAGTIYRLGVTGADPALARFWARARMGWRDVGEVKVPTAPVQYQKIEGDDW